MQTIGPEFRLTEEDQPSSDMYLREWSFQITTRKWNPTPRHLILISKTVRDVQFLVRISWPRDYQPQKFDLAAQLYVPDPKEAVPLSDAELRRWRDARSLGIPRLIARRRVPWTPSRSLRVA